jgi:hypothetical protein
MNVFAIAARVAAVRGPEQCSQCRGSGFDARTLEDCLRCNGTGKDPSAPAAGSWKLVSDIWSPEKATEVPEKELLSVYLPNLNHGVFNILRVTPSGAHAMFGISRYKEGYDVTQLGGSMDRDMGLFESPADVLRAIKKSSDRIASAGGASRTASISWTQVKGVLDALDVKMDVKKTFMQIKDGIQVPLVGGQLLRVTISD